MFLEKTVAKKYANALLTSFKLQDSRNWLFDEINIFFNVINSSSTVKRVLFNKYVPKKYKIAICQNLFSHFYPSNILRSFIEILINNQRLHLLKIIVNFLKIMINHQNNIETVKLTFATKINEHLLSQIQQTLDKYLNFKNVKLVINFNQKIIGGVIIEQGLRIIDLSILSKIKKICSINDNSKLGSIL